MPPQALSARATAALQHLVKTQGWGYQRRLAHAAGLPPSSLSRILQGRQPVTLALLEAIGRLDEINPLALLAGPEDELQPVSVEEAELLRYVRTWPRSVTRALLSFAAHFAAEGPRERELRDALTLFRGLDEHQRRHVLAYLITLTEGLPRDLAIALRLPEEDPRRSASRPPKPVRPK